MGHVLEAMLEADDDAIRLIDAAADRGRMSARGYHRTLKVARTIADLEGSEPVRRPHVAEALAYRHAAR